MGASDSKLVFKQGIFKLAEKKSIPADDPYWASFWELPESQEDVFSLFSPADIRRIRDEAFENLETLILAVSSRLCALVALSSFPNPETAPERDALNCIRILTRLLPFIYEVEQLETWEDRYFWGTRRRRVGRRQSDNSNVLFDESAPVEDQRAEEESHFEESKPLAEELIDTLIELLFFADFSIPNAQGKKRVSFTIWQSGVGCNIPVASNLDMEGRRMEVLRLLLTLSSKSIYTPTNVLPIQGIRAITYITTISDKQLVLTMLCSMLNTTLKYNPASWRVPYDHVVFKDPKQLYVTYCLQLLLVLVLYPVPEAGNGVPPKNYFRHFLGKLHRPQDFQFIVDGMTRILNQPVRSEGPVGMPTPIDQMQMQASSSYLPGSQKSLTWAPEMIMLFWESLQCNKRFRSFIVDTDRAHDFVVLILFHAIHDRNDSSKQGVVRMCIFVLQTMSVEPTFGARLNKRFQHQDTLPQAIRVPNFHGSYTDFLIISIHTLITSSKGKLDAVYPALLAIINNVAPHAMDLSVQASSKLLQLFATMSSPSFLIANESNHLLLHSILEAVNAILEHQYDKNTTFVFSVLKAHKRFYALRDFAVDGGRGELDRQAQLRKEAAEAPENWPTPIRINTTDSTRSSMTGTNARAPSLSDVPEEAGAFAIGDDEDSDEGGNNPPMSAIEPRQSAEDSGAASVAESTDSLPTQLRGMSEKARGKMPASQSSFSRQTSNASLSSMSMPTYPPGAQFEANGAWMESWLPHLPLHTSLTLIDQLLPQMPEQGRSGTTSTALKAIREALVEGLEASPVRVHLFEWTPLSLGWYESLLWSFIFSTELTIMKGAPGVWKGTNIKLFRVQETAVQGPTLMAPQGAVDAVGSNLVKRIGNLNLKGAMQTSSRTSTGGRVRDV